MEILNIYFDGGCRPTNPGNKYGSYEVILADSVVHAVSEAELGKGTNNEAEFEILIQALEWSALNLKKGGYPLGYFSLKLFTDSTIVANRLSGRNKACKTEPQQRMHNLALKCLKLMVQFASFKVIWQPRQKNVDRFGH